jgi:hypothetical protein
MEHTGGILLPEELNGTDIHCLENILTLENGMHSMF